MRTELDIDGEKRYLHVIRTGEQTSEIYSEEDFNIKLKQGATTIRHPKNHWHDCQMEDLREFLQKYPAAYLDHHVESKERDFYRNIWNRIAGKEYIASSSKRFSVSEIDFDGFEVNSLASNYSFECDFDPHSSFQWHLLLKISSHRDDKTAISSHPILVIIGRTASYNLENPDEEESDPYVVMFYHHTTDQKTVDELIGRCKTAKKEKSPQISYLCQGMGGLFYKETPVSKNAFYYNNYNEDFTQTDIKIKEWAAKEESCGLSILHGKPGTGKTYYLRHLAGHIKNLTYIPSGIAHQIGNPEFITFLSENPGRVFIIEDAEGVLISNGDSRSSALQNLLNATDGLMGDIIKSKFIFTFNTDLKNIDAALLRPGRAALVYEFKELAPERTSALCDKLGREKLKASMTLAEIYNAEVVGAETINREKGRIGF
jgi:hypothetical protein